MRRPPALPPPQEGRAPAPPSPASTSPRAEGTGAITPLLAPGADEPAGRTAPGDPGPDAADLGLRDVWRASRARRRALRAEVRRFTVRQRRRRMLWLGVLGALVLLVVGTVGAAYSPLFAVHRVEVVGTSQLNPAEVATALDGQIGTPLASIDDSAVKAALVQFPLVESYTLEARPPNDLVVRIVERLPVGVIDGTAGFTVVDAAGVALSTTPDAPAGLPLVDVTGGVRSDAFRAAGQVMRALPEALRAQVTAVAATTPDDVSFTLGATDTRVVWGSADESALKTLSLQAAMVQRPPETARLYDVSSPQAVVVG